MGIILGILCLIIILFIFLDGSFMPSKSPGSNDTYDHYSEDMTATQFALIQSGISAPSSHNMQPWKIEILDDKQFNLYIDMDKDLSVIDSDHRQLLMSQGTFIGRVEQEAKALGITIDIVYNKIDFDSNYPLVAEFHLVDATVLTDTPDAVSSSSILVEETHENLDLIFSETFLNQFEGFSLSHIKKEDDDFSTFQEYLRKGTEIESKNQDATQELLNIFRFTKWDRNKYRYGLSLNTMHPVVKTFIEPLYPHITNWESFGEASISTFETRLENETDYLLIKKSNPSSHDYILIGEAMMAITDQAGGYVPRPAVQLLESIDGMNDISHAFQSDYGQDESVVYILGFTDVPTAYHETVRHQVKDILIHF